MTDNGQYKIGDENGKYFWKSDMLLFSTVRLYKTLQV